MSRPHKTDDIDPRAIAAGLWRDLGGKTGIAKWGKSHRSLAYQLISKLMAQPLVQNNVNVRVDHVNEEQAKRHLEDAFLRIIAARQASVGDPAVYVDGERLTDAHNYIEHDPRPATDASTPEAAEPRPAIDEPRPATGDAVDVSLNESSKSPQKGPLSKPGGVQTSTGGGTKQNSMHSNSGPSVPGLFAGAALDGSADTRSTTQKFLDWPGHNRPP
jgi:hypothetical protein